LAKKLFSALLGLTVRPVSRIGGTVSHLVDKHLVARANTVLLLSMLWGGFAACALGAMVYDLTHWLSD
jgi:hypothetical protein